MRNVNPLSGLPGNPTITEELESRLARSEHFALLYVDIDRFKEFNDHYGFTRGDRVITMLAEILIHTAGADQRFVGHIGGDDFVLLARAEDAEAIAEEITRRFDDSIQALYDPEDRARGWIEAHDRRGRLRHTPFATATRCRRSPTTPTATQRSGARSRRRTASTTRCACGGVAS